MAEQNEGKAVEIFSGSFHRAAVIKSMLENHGIYVFMQNEHIGSIAPWQVSSGGFNPVRLLISSLNYEQASKLLEEFNEQEEGNPDQE